jgi:hypothetical protein
LYAGVCKRFVTWQHDDVPGLGLPAKRSIAAVGFLEHC